MTFPLRLTDELHREARERAARVGISLNALISVALDAYLRAPEVQRRPRAPVAEPKPGATATGAVVPHGWTKEENDAFLAKQAIEFAREEAHKARQVVLTDLGAPSPLLESEKAAEAAAGPPLKLFQGYSERELWEWIERQDNGARVPKQLRQVVHQFRQKLGV